MRAFYNPSLGLLVLRIGLEQAARHFGLAAVAVGKGARSRMWGERPEVVG